MFIHSKAMHKSKKKTHTHTKTNKKTGCCFNFNNTAFYTLLADSMFYKYFSHRQESYDKLKVRMILIS